MIPEPRLKLCIGLLPESSGRCYCHCWCERPGRGRFEIQSNSTALARFNYYAIGWCGAVSSGGAAAAKGAGVIAKRTKTKKKRLSLLHKAGLGPGCITTSLPKDDGTNNALFSDSSNPGQPSWSLTSARHIIFQFLDCTFFLPRVIIATIICLPLASPLFFGMAEFFSRKPWF